MLVIELWCDDGDDDDNEEDYVDKVVDNKGNICSINNIVIKLFVYYKIFKFVW